MSLHKNECCEILTKMLKKKNPIMKRKRDYVLYDVYFVDFVLRYLKFQKKVFLNDLRTFM